MKRPPPVPPHAAGLPPAIINACMDHATEAILVADMHAEGAPLCFVSDAFVTITGYSKLEAIGRSCSFLQGTDRNQPEVDLIRKALQSGKGIEVTLRNYKKDGTLFYNHLRLVPAKDRSGTLSHYIGYVNDVSAQRRAEETIYSLSFRDRISGLLNRGAFSNEVRLARAAERGGIVVLKLDIVRFHDINTGYGFDVGDRLLQAVARRLETTNAFAVGRLGANEFALAFRAKSGEQAEKIVAGTLRLAQNSYTLHENVFSLRFSAGYAYGANADDGIELIRKAGTALHRSKRSVLKETYTFSDADDAQARARVQLTADLKRAVTNNEFLLHYQPKVSLSDLQIVGAEALIRWQHPALGLQLPAQFIPQAEELGLIGEIDDWALTAANRLSCAANTNGENGFRVAVNLSGRDILQPHSVDRIIALCDRDAIDARQLILEMTETVMITSSSHVLGAMNELRSRGFGLAIDDFGTGYSSLGYLDQFPVSEIKIDRSLVKELDKSTTKRIIVESVIKIGAASRINIVAEGVESHDELAVLKELNCPYGQGYLFGRPQHSDGFLARLRSGLTS